MSLKFIERKGKRLLLRILASSRRSSRAEVGDLQDHDIRRVLVVRQDYRLGNLVFTIPLIKALKEDWKKADIYIVAGAAFASLLERLPELSGIISFDHRRAVRNPFYWLSFRRSLKKMEFDLVIEVGNMSSISVNNMLTALAARGKFTVGYDRREASSFLNILVPQLEGDRHESQIFLHLADHITGKERDYLPKMNPTSEEMAEGSEMLNQIGLNGSNDLVGIHIGGRYDKRWEIDKFEQLAKELASSGVTVLVIAGPGEKGLLDDADFRGIERVHPMAPKSIGLLIGLVSNCRIFVSGDCGPLHVAAALGVPCIQIFRMENWKRYGYPAAPHRIVKPIDPAYDEVLSACKETLGL